MDTLEKQLADLRLKWKKYPDKRKVIELQAKILKMGSNSEPDIFEAAKEIFNVKK